MSLVKRLRDAYNLGKEADVLYENTFWFHPHLVPEHAQYATQRDAWEARIRQIKQATSKFGLLERFVFGIAQDLNMVPIKALPLSMPLALISN